MRYWLPGPAEDGYAATLAEVLAADDRCRVLPGPPGRLGLPRARAKPPGMGDAYAACDLVVFPSTGGEGSGSR